MYYLVKRFRNDIPPSCMDSSSNQSGLEVIFRSMTGDLSATIFPHQTIKDVKEQCFDRDASLIRLFYRGKELVNHSYVRDYQLSNGQVINAIVKQQQNSHSDHTGGEEKQQEGQEQGQEGEGNLGLGGDIPFVNGNQEAQSSVFVENLDFAFLLCILLSAINLFIWILSTSIPTILNPFNKSLLIFMTLINVIWLYSFIQKYTRDQRTR